MSDEKKVAQKAVETEPTIQDLQRLINRMGAQRHAEAEDFYGTTLPKIPEGATEEPRVVSMRCHYCNKPALEFLGSSWRQTLADGTQQMLSRPPVGTPIAELRWIQDKGPHKSRRRSEPICQWCGNAQPLGMNGGVRVDFLVRTEQWQRAKTAALAAAAASKKRRNYNRDVGFAEEPELAKEN